VGSFDGNQHSAAVTRYRELDVEHLDSSADRILRLWAERSAQARDAFPDDVALIRQQAARKRKLLPFRALFAGAKDYLLELKPCWVMSPLVVSQTLPAEQLFDVVIFDEASQVRPADAIPAVVRGAQLVVAGDEKQLPPTAFFLASTPEEEEAEAEDAPQLAAVEGFESILEALGMLLHARTLEWHYRSRDERLISFSNAHFYDWHLTTFPGVNDSEPISHVLVPHRPGLVGQEDSASDEVAEVVRLILDHAENRSTESLGVIAMGIKHADRIEGALFEALKERPDLDAFFNEDSEERFFVKNLERVQGDERDAIVLSVGYSKTPEGRLLYRFGPLNLEGGARRLNVAITRARRRLTLVSSFSSVDMDPNRAMSDGAALLRDYLRYAESRGGNLGEHALERPELNPFEIDVRDRLAKAGVSVVPQLGVCGYLVDFAVQHPRQPGRYVLAIECDGASYHSSPTARDRDRLRQEQLERLGWRFHRIWSTDWFGRKDEALDRALQAIADAVEIADNPDHPPAADGAPAPRLVTAVDAPSRGPRPNVRRYQPIDWYTHGQLVGIARWINSDTLLRTDEELLEAVMADLGFQRRGKKIVSAISLAAAQANADRVSSAQP
jgi:very-short-patch-repair endonuclease